MLSSLMNCADKAISTDLKAIPKLSWCPCQVWRRNTPAQALYTIGDFSGLKMFPDLLHLKYLDSQANIRQ